jgi:hypothetical protein
MFAFGFHTNFLRGYGKFEFPKREIDKANKDKLNRHFYPNFKVDVIFSNPNEPRAISPPTALTRTASPTSPTLQRAHPLSPSPQRPGALLTSPASSAASTPERFEQFKEICSGCQAAIFPSVWPPHLQEQKKKKKCLTFS